MSRFQLATGILVLAVLTMWAFTEDSPEANEPGVRVAATDAYNPVLAGETLPDGFRQLLPRDSIAPIYDPVFTTADGVDWPGDIEIIGVERDGAAKAYPVSLLNRRELVLDEIGGEPILVSW